MHKVSSTCFQVQPRFAGRCSAFVSARRNRLRHRLTATFNCVVHNVGNKGAISCWTSGRPIASPNMRGRTRLGEPSEAHVNPLRLDLAVRSEVDQILSRRRKGITTSKRWIGEAQAEIKGSLEEVGEGDQTVVVAATVDGRVDSRPTAPHLRVPASRAHPPSFFFFPPSQAARS